MKNVLLASILAAAFSASAHAEGAYVGLGISAQEHEYNDSKGAVKIFGGYDITSTWGVEVGHLAVADYAYSTLSDYSNTGGRGRWSESGNATYLAAKMTTPINQKFSVITKLGVAYNHTKFDYTNITREQVYDRSGHQSTTGLYAAIGLKYALTEKVALTLELERMGRRTTSGAQKPESVSLNASYSF
jgi:OmpA-OmpF porin, OOP family